MVDQLEGNPILQEVLGKAYEPLRMFHVKLEQEGEPRGLIGPRDVDIIWERHILNSAAIVPFITDNFGVTDWQTVQGTIADVGSGGGFPGIIIAACLPQASITLIEPMERRVIWLQEVVDELQLQNVQIQHCRAEEAVVPQHGFDVVTCRAVAPMRKLVGFTMPLLRHGGRLIALKGASIEQEIEKGRSQITKAKGVNPRAYEAPVGPGLQSTHIAMVDKR
ncbi:ribosomal RNA small subunit methyltransferase G [Galliscardovia ingluviei]|uniref:Ribosomal RNA small subunit methyltransferase G n=1 Tax=Galliscardovia ingluviei TaxID=1769422 RepID=A0A8J3EZL4_9BIFI|nr:16S rRNA (guanine(527)-N(7))-methyltransferase RsmG [Galliscardovia ingluviei]GGI15049.1 ribosomal RNA small subunit methyltransferase G [Galliscardovia ingluviei]